MGEILYRTNLSRACSAAWPWVNALPGRLLHQRHWLHDLCSSLRLVSRDLCHDWQDERARAAGAATQKIW